MVLPLSSGYLHDPWVSRRSTQLKPFSITSSKGRIHVNNMNKAFVAFLIAVAAFPASADLSVTIMEAERKLEKMPVGKNEAHLAIMDENGKVAIVTIKIDSNTQQTYGYAESLKPRGYRIGWRNLNGFNTPFEVMEPEGHTVIAMKRRLKSRPGAGVYVPFTEAILPLAPLGIVLARHIIDEAYQNLQALNVSSRALPWETVGVLTPPEVAYIILLIEHLDHDRFMSEPLPGLLAEQHAIMGANLNRSYRYAKSSAGALGMWQQMPRSYRYNCKRYPTAKLKSDFVAGMSDLVNGAKAFYLHNDSDLEVLVASGKRLASNSSYELGRYGAAAYNCGATRVIRAIDDEGVIRLEELPLETQIYVRKFEQTWKLLKNDATVPDDNAGPQMLVSATKK
jgi:hypothetical protein